MEEWKSYKLVDFIEFNPSISLKKGTMARKITMDQLTPHSRDIYSWGYEPYSGGAKFQNGDTIMARITPCLENGKHAFISLLDDGETAYGSTEYIVLRGKPGISDNRFVYYLSHYPDFKNAAIKSMVGSSGRQRAQVDVLKNLEFYLPGLEEQKQIADTLSALDDKIALNNRINHNLEEQAQALYKSWFIDFEPFKGGKFVDSGLRLIPEGWHVGTLSEIADITMGQSPSGSSFNEDGRGIVFYQGRTEFGFRFPLIKLFTTEPTRYAEPHSVLMSVRAPVGDINVALVKCCIGRGLAAITAKYNAYSFVLYTLKGKSSELDLYNGEGTVFGSINRKDLERLSVLIPPKSIIQRFNDCIKPIDDSIEIACKEIVSLSYSRDSLLPKLMSGQLTFDALDC
jgi:type I restriction enzyme S subunit